MSLIDDGTDVKFTRDDLYVCRRLVAPKAAQWLHIGMELGFSVDILEVIKLDNQDCNMCIVKVLDCWLRQNILKHRRRGGPKLSQLVAAIEGVDYAFAEGLLEKFKSMQQEERKTTM